MHHPEGGERLPSHIELGRVHPEPRIYVASLADYNNGRLHGDWIEAAQDPEDLAAEIHSMLRRSPIPGAEEYAIHDYEGFGPLRISEYEGLETISRIATGIATHGEAYAALATIVGTDHEDALGRFEDHYLGQYETVEAFARHIADELGYEDELQKLPEHLQPYVSIDYAAVARDMEMELHVVEHDDGVWLFDTRL